MKQFFLVVALFIAPTCKAADNKQDENIEKLNAFIATKQDEGYDPGLIFLNFFNFAVGQLPEDGIPLLTEYLKSAPHFLSNEKIIHYQGRLRLRANIAQNIG